MKKLIMFLPALCLGMLLHAQNANTQQTQADVEKFVEFKELDHDFGKIPQGKPAEFDLLMKNISSDSLKIDNVQVGCGCTTPKYEQGHMYAPGETFKVTVGFNAAALGSFNKMITIFFNNGAMQKVIRFHGETFTAPAAVAPAATVQQLKPAPAGN